jgi:hypothetical protein
MANYIRNRGAQGQSIEDSTTTPPTIEGMFQQILHATQNTLAAVNAATTVSVDPLSSTNSGGKFSYATVASGRYRGSATPTSVFCPQQSATMIAGPLRKLRELKVRAANNEGRELISGILNHEILRTIQEHSPSSGAIGVHKLKSGDVVIQTLEREGKKRLEKYTDWKGVFGTEAEVVRDRFPVMVHAVRVKDINITDQKEAIKMLQEENATLHPGLEILRVAWPWKVVNENKTFSSLILELGSPEEGNRAISRGLLVGPEVKTCELFQPGRNVLLCFNCYKFGHTGKTCRHQTRCGHCAGQHSTQECTKQNNLAAKACSNCESKGHEAWSYRCPIYDREKRKANERYENRPTWFPVDSPEPALFQPRARANAVFQFDTQFPTLGEKRQRPAPETAVLEKRRPGRPSNAKIERRKKEGATPRNTSLFPSPIARMFQAGTLGSQNQEGPASQGTGNLDSDLGTQEEEELWTTVSSKRQKSSQLVDPDTAIET